MSHVWSAKKWTVDTLDDPQNSSFSVWQHEPNFPVVILYKDGALQLICCLQPLCTHHMRRRSYMRRDLLLAAHTGAVRIAAMSCLWQVILAQKHVSGIYNSARTCLLHVSLAAQISAETCLWHAFYTGVEPCLWQLIRSSTRASGSSNVRRDVPLVAHTSVETCLRQLIRAQKLASGSSYGHGDVPPASHINKYFISIVLQWVRCAETHFWKIIRCTSGSSYGYSDVPLAAHTVVDTCLW